MTEITWCFECSLYYTEGFSYITNWSGVIMNIAQHCYAAWWQTGYRHLLNPEVGFTMGITTLCLWCNSWVRIGV